MNETRAAAVPADAIRPSAMSKTDAMAALARAALPPLLLWGVLVWTLGIPYWVTVAVALPASSVLGATFVALRAPQAVDSQHDG